MAYAADSAHTMHVCTLVLLSNMPMIPLLQRSDIISPLIFCVAGLVQSISWVPITVIQGLGYTCTWRP